MFVLQYKPGMSRKVYNPKTRQYEPKDIGGKYVRHTWSGTEGGETDDLERAKVYNTSAGAKNNSDAYACDIIPVKITLE